MLCAHTDNTLPIERTEPATAQSRHKHYEQWYARVDDECDCGQAEKCGSKYRRMVQMITAKGAMSTPQQRQRLNGLIHKVRQYWPVNSTHYSKQSATCDHALMPKELLPRLGRKNSLSHKQWPHVCQHSMNDVIAIRFIRSSSGNQTYGAMWETLQPRLQQYADTGAGTVAEAIVANDYWRNGQVAHELPSGGRPQALKCRHNKV
jgi:hypothetical protein